MSRRELWEQVDGDLYEILEVGPDATTEEIQSAWRDMAKRFHPDRGGSAQDFQRAEISYQVLSDQASRHAYDSRFFGARRGDLPRPPPQWHGDQMSSVHDRPEQGRPAEPYALPEQTWSNWQVLLLVLGLLLAVILAVVFAAALGIVIVLAVVTVAVGSALKRGQR